MREIMQFKSTKERLKYLSGGFEEVIPVEVKAEKVEKDKVKIEKEKFLDNETKCVYSMGVKIRTIVFERKVMRCCIHLNFLI